MSHWSRGALFVTLVSMGLFSSPSGAVPTIKKVGTNTGDTTSTKTTNDSGLAPITTQTGTVQPTRFVTVSAGIIPKTIKTNGINVHTPGGAISGVINSVPSETSDTHASNDIVSLSDRVSELDAAVKAKQDVLTPENGIKIEKNMIGLSPEMAGLPEKIDEISQELSTLNNKVDDIVDGGNNETLSDLQNDVTNLQNTVGDTPITTTAQTVIAAINELNDAIDNLEAASNLYAPGAGVSVTRGANEGDPSTIGLALPNNSTAGTQYVFQPDDAGGGTWIPLDVQDNWNPGF